MKLPLTDQFLFDIYNYFEKGNEALDFMFKPPTMINYLPGPKNPVFNKYRNIKNREKFAKLVYYLKRNGYIKVNNLKNNKAIILTDRGVNRALIISFKIEGKKVRKDGKWIMVIFDVPEKYRKSRNLLRNILSNLGYKIFQQSVWITPYDVSDKTEKLLALYSLDKYVKIFLIEKI